MESLLTLLKAYGWQLFLVGVLSSILVGAIKTPIRAALVKKYPDKESAAYKKMETIFDTCVIIGTYLVALLAALVYLFLAKMFTWQGLLSATLSVYAIQSASYIVWKKLGLKKVLELLWAQIVSLFHKLFDRDKDGKISFEEATEAVKDFIKDGKLDVSAILQMAEKEIPNFAENVVKSLTEEAGPDAEVDPKEEAKKVKEAVKDSVKLAKESAKLAKEEAKAEKQAKKEAKKEEKASEKTPEVPSETQVIKTEENKISIIKF